MIRYDKIRTIMGGNYASVSKIHLDLLLVSDCNSDQLPLFKYSHVIKTNTIYVGFRIIIILKKCCQTDESDSIISFYVLFASLVDRPILQQSGTSPPKDSLLAFASFSK